jgi:preprotein translocase subunit SecA
MRRKNVILTEQGSKQIEKILSVQDLYDPRSLIPYIISALKEAHYILTMFITLSKMVE